MTQYLFTILLPLIHCFFHPTTVPASPPIETTITIQNNRSIHVQENISDPDETDDFSPGLLFFAVIGFAFVLVCVGVGLGLTVLALLLLFGLVGAGVLSASILVGLNKKSFESGFKTLIISSSSFAGWVLGITGFWAVNEMAEWWNTSTALIFGSVTGLVAGLSLGLFASYVIRKLTTVLRNKLQSA